MIEVRDIHKSYGPVEVIRGISFDVEPGEVVCIIGPSGSGKSTILRCLNGLETYQKGDIRIDGQRVDPEDKSIKAIRQRVSMVFQRFNLFPHRTAIENVMEGPVYVKGMSRAEAREMAAGYLKKVGLGDKMESYPGNLSGGQQQRVAIARALAMQPEAILFDEPTSALDPELVGDVLSVMRQVAEEGMTMVVVTHEMGFARDVASHVIYLKDGRIEEEGPPEQIFGDPRSPHMQQFIRSIA